MSDTFFQKPVGIASLIGSAIVGPYVFFGSTDGPPKDAAAVRSPLDPSSVGPVGTPVSAPYPGMGESDPYRLTGVPSYHAPIADFREVFRFDISPAWVPQHFARVTTVVAESKLDGLRVPLVTGTQPTDLAGVLTYYFDGRQVVRRIQFEGTSGDPSLLVALMTQFYHLQAEPSVGRALYTSRWNNRITSLMQITAANVIVAHDTTSRYRIFLELNQPSMEYGLTAEAQQQLLSASYNQQW